MMLLLVLSGLTQCSVIDKTPRADDVEADQDHEAGEDGVEDLLAGSEHLAEPHPGEAAEQARRRRTEAGQRPVDKT